MTVYLVSHASVTIDQGYATIQDNSGSFSFKLLIKRKTLYVQDRLKKFKRSKICLG